MLVDLLLVLLANAISVALALFAFKDLSLPTKTGVLLASTLIVGTAWYRRIYLPALHIRTRHADTIISTMILPTLIDNYKAHVPGGYQLRACVLRVVRHKLSRDWPYWVPVLKMQHSTEGYSKAEEDLEWTGRMGACGRAATLNKIVYYDPEEAPEAAGGMPPQHVAITKHLRSILAVPIYRPNDETRNKPVAVLSLDSTSGIATTRFNTRSSHGIVTTSAALIGSFLP